MIDRNSILLLIVLAIFFVGSGYGQTQVLDNSRHHLRNGEKREWSEFSVQAERELDLRFSSHENLSNQTLSLRQYDVKQNWRVRINDHDLGILVSDEKDIIAYFSIPPGTLREGENALQIKCTVEVPDDILISDITLYTRSSDEVLSDATLDIIVSEHGSNLLLPARITIVNEKRSLQTVSAFPEGDLAIRPGYVYTGNGKASLQLPAGVYTIYANRGSEYGIDSARLDLRPGDHIQKRFTLKREMETTGWISSDTHIHTFTHSGHGDATEEERVITIAGEGIELPIITDHNVYVDLKPVAEKMGVSSYFTLVTGDELTTKVGHFNVFETKTGTPVIDHQVNDWNDVTENIHDTANNKVIILNHARDIHNGFRPFDPAHHLSGAGMRNDDWAFPANAMEVVNSGSQQTDIMTLYRDWFGMLNAGYFLTPAGSSDSHDVSRYIVGQGRTYIQCDDSDPGKIDVDAAIKNFRDGRVMVSSGLFTKVTVNDTYGAGDLTPYSRYADVSVEVSGPSWIKAHRICLYANGKKIREEATKPSKNAILKWKGSWKIPVPKHDIFLVAIAEGPGSGMPYWPIAKPYQPSSPDWQPRVIGSSGAIWLDADRNGKRNSARDYAGEIVDSSGGDIVKIITRLASYDEAVATQAAALLWKSGTDLSSTEVTEAMKRAAPATKEGFGVVIKEINFIRK